VNHVGTGAGAEVAQTRGGRRADAGARGEDRAEHRCPDRAAEPAEERRGGHRDPELLPRNAVLDRRDQHLPDHSESQPEHHQPDRDGGAAGVRDHGREQHQRDRHQGEADDRVALVAPGLRHREAGEVRGHGDPDHHRDEQQPGLGRGGVRGGLEVERHEHSDREQRRGRKEQRHARDRHRAHPQQVERHDRIGPAPLAGDQRKGQRHAAGDQRDDRRRAPGVAISAPDARERQRDRRAGEQDRSGDVEAFAGFDGLDRVPGELEVQPGEGRGAKRKVDVEHPAPARVLDEDAADQRPHDGGERERDGDVTLVAASLSRGDEIADRGHGQRHQAAGGHALRGARDDQPGHVLGGAAHRGGGEEQHQ